MFKKELTKKIQAWCLENPGKSINKYEVVEIAFPGMVTSLSNKAIIKEGFRATGTYPWDPSQVSFSRMAASSVFASEEQIRPIDTDDGQLLVDHVPVLGEGRDTATATAASTAFRELFPSTSTSAETSIFPGSISDMTLELPVPESSPTLAVTSEASTPVPSVSASVTNEVSAPAPVSSVSSPTPVTSDVSAHVTTDSAPVLADQSATLASNTPDLQFTPIRSLEDRKRR